MCVVYLATAFAACSSERPPVATIDHAREPTFEVAFVDRIDDQPATHVAVGGRVRVQIADGPATFTSVVGPFAMTNLAHDTFAITALDRGSGSIEIETITGFARFRLTAEPIAQLAADNTTVLLLDGAGKRLVDSSLRVAGGGAPVALAGAWDRLDLGSLAPGVHEIFVQTDLLGPTRLHVRRSRAFISGAGGRTSDP
jgi:hypothetical protein